MNAVVMPRRYVDLPSGPWFDGRLIALPVDADLCYALHNVVIRDFLVFGDEASASFDVSDATGYYRTEPTGPQLWIDRHGLNAFTAVLGIGDDPNRPEWHGLGAEMVDRLDRCFVAKAPLTVYSALGKWTLILAERVRPAIIIFPTIMPPQPGGYYVEAPPLV